MEGKPVGIMPNPLDTREIFFTNLLLLGFEPGAMETKFRIPFNRDMFVLPNKVGMEAVMHFLFYQLNPQLASEEFRNCWPVCDKTQEQQFRKVCFSWVARISEEDPDSNLPRAAQSLFHSPGGDRFYSFLLSFTLHVLLKVRLRDHGKGVTTIERPKRNPHNQLLTGCISKALTTRVAVCRQRFLKQAQCAEQVHQDWKTIAIETTKQNRAISKMKREIEREIRQLESSSGTKLHRVTSQFTLKSCYQQEVDALKRTQQLQKVRDLWARLEDFYDAVSKQREIINSVLDGEANKYNINAAEIQLKVPDLLLRTCENNLKKGSIGNTFVGGKLNLLSLVQLWNLSLSLLLEQVQQDPIQDFTQHSAEVNSQLHTHRVHLSNTQNVRRVLKHETIVDLRDSVDKLRLPLYRQLEQHGVSPRPFTVKHGLGLTQATPPVSFHASETPVSERMMSFSDTLRHQPAGPVSTPEVVQSWTERLEKHQPAENDQLTSSTGQLNYRDIHTPILNGRKTVQTRSQIPQPVIKLGSKVDKVQHSGQKPWKNQKNVFTTANMSADRVKSKRSSTPNVRPRLTSKTDSHKKNVRRSLPSHSDKTTWIKQALADEIVSAMSVGSSDASYGGSSCDSSRSNTPKVQAIADPTAGLDEMAFQPGDLIPRTPVAKLHCDATPNQEAHEPAIRDETPRDVDSSKPGRLFEAILGNSLSVSTPDSVRTYLFPPTPSPESVETVSTSRTPFSLVQEEKKILGKNVREDDLDNLLDLHHVSRTEIPQTTVTSFGAIGTLQATPTHASSVDPGEHSTNECLTGDFLVPFTPLQTSNEGTNSYVTDQLKALQLDSPFKLSTFPDSSNAGVPPNFPSPLIQLSEPVIAGCDDDSVSIKSETAVKEHSSHSQSAFSPFGQHDIEFVESKGKMDLAESPWQNENSLTSEEMHSKGENLFTSPTHDYNFNEMNKKVKDNTEVETCEECVSRNSPPQHDDRILNIVEPGKSNGIAEGNAALEEDEKTALPLSPPRQVDTSELMHRLNRLKAALKKSPFSADGVTGPEDRLLSLGKEDTVNILERLGELRKAQQEQVAPDDDVALRTTPTFARPLASRGTATPGSDTGSTRNVGNIPGERARSSGLSTPVNDPYLLVSPGKPNTDEPQSNGFREKPFTLDLPSTCKKRRDNWNADELDDGNSEAFLNSILGGKDSVSEQRNTTPVRRALDYNRGGAQVINGHPENPFITGQTTPSGTWLTNGVTGPDTSFDALGGNEVPFLVPASPFVSNTNILKDDALNSKPSWKEEELSKNLFTSPLSNLLSSNTTPAVGQLVDLE